MITIAHLIIIIIIHKCSSISKFLLRSKSAAKSMKKAVPYAVGSARNTPAAMLSSSSSLSPLSSEAAAPVLHVSVAAQRSSPNEELQERLATERQESDGIRNILTVRIYF